MKVFLKCDNIMSFRGNFKFAVINVIALTCTFLYDIVVKFLLLAW